ncbi:MAG: hypothetical protein K8E66_14670 [Phycisphaerales bacterium]|nr:hypothetical protein [Phycisphaerales bacterium]
MCPECGRVVSDSDITRWRERERRTAAYDEQRSLLLWAVILLAYAAGGAWFGLAAEDVGLLVALLGPGAALFVTIMFGVGCGVVFGRFANEHDRRAATVLWLGRVWILHLPWLAIAPCAMVALVVAAFERVKGGDALAVESVASTGFVIWIFSSLLAFVVWAAVFNRESHKCCVRYSALQVLILAGSVLAMMAINMMIGMLGGVLAMEGAIGMMGLEQPWIDW